MVDDETIDRDEGKEVSFRRLRKSLKPKQDVVSSGEVSLVPTPNFDLKIATPTGNVPPTSSGSILVVNEKEAIENMLLIATKGGLVGGYECDDETIGS
ncbi:hypothetical protein A4A49_63694 [Nicotiana attenuata]|uniref:Uncharacterized protein n=1 Tax=Nicotiana attenuata TaxID=49451 RepID=A0A314KX85_NICAT|nr:hypothetical protein A4A49_63694 [Nicotiana attenuata]